MKKSIVSEIAGLKPRKTGKGTWWERFAKRDPVSARLAREAVLDWVSNGSTRKVFPTILALHRYLLGRDPENPRPPAIPTETGYDSFCRYIRHLRG